MWISLKFAVASMEFLWFLRFCKQLGMCSVCVLLRLSVCYLPTAICGDYKADTVRRGIFGPSVQQHIESQFPQSNVLMITTVCPYNDVALALATHNRSVTRTRTCATSTITRGSGHQNSTSSFFLILCSSVNIREKRQLVWTVHLLGGTVRVNHLSTGAHWPTHTPMSGSLHPAERIPLT